MVVVLTGGGTAGHINPALALAEVLEARGHTVYFAGTPTGLEARLVPDAGIPFEGFEASGFNRKHPTSLFTGIAKIAHSTRAAKKWFAQIKPDVVVGFGGYVSIPVARAAEQLHIPVVIHEQNSVMGMANAYLARKAQAICLTYDYATRQVPENKRTNVRITGNPVRASVLEATREQGRAMLGIPEDALMLLVFGGSQGARSINEAIVALKDELLARENLYIVHATGPKELESVESALALTDDQAKRWQLKGYLDCMGEALAAADMIVSRAGATTLAEVAARAVPALLVPFPYATEDHQTTNARAAVESGCALLIADGQMVDAQGTPTQMFRELIDTLVDDAPARAAMQAAAQQRAATNATEALADAVESAAR